MTKTDEAYWETYYARSLQRRGVLRREDCYCRCDELLPLLPATATTVLVVAAGTSEVPEVLAMEGMKVTAMDVSSSCVEAMRSVSDDTVEWCCGDAFAMPKDWSETFDLVIDKGLIGHKGPDLPCVQKLLAEYGRVLRPGGQVLVVALSPMLSAPEWHQRMVQLSGCVAYILQKDPLDRPAWISKIQRSGREVLLHLRLSASEREQLQLSTQGCWARLERRDTGDLWMLPLTAGCRSAKWTRDGLKLTLEDLKEEDGE